MVVSFLVVSTLFLLSVLKTGTRMSVLLKEKLQRGFGRGKYSWHRKTRSQALRIFLIRTFFIFFFPFPFIPFSEPFALRYCHYTKREKKRRGKEECFFQKTRKRCKHVFSWNTNLLFPKPRCDFSLKINRYNCYSFQYTH